MLGTIRQMIDEFTLSSQEIQTVADAFSNEMEKVKKQEPTSLKMIPSYFTLPTGKERGSYLSMDFGGTNIRLLEVDLNNGLISIRRQKNILLKDTDQGYDYTSELISGDELFSFIAKNIGDFIGQQKEYSLGHTFSFPCRQQGVNKAILLNWTKEIKAHDTEGKDISTILEQALLRTKIFCVRPVAIINDTVGTLLAAAYKDKFAHIGSICGTGHNTCYFSADKFLEPMIVNLESGNFNKLTLNPVDDIIDKNSSKPGQQLLEKVVSGKYLGELARQVFCILSIERGLNLKWDQPYSYTAKDVSLLLLGKKVELGLSSEEYVALQKLFSRIVTRAAQLVAATYVGILQYAQLDNGNEHTIAIDGSLYEKMPGFKENLCRALKWLLRDKKYKINICFTKNGSGVGAAIAAAMVKNNPG